MPKTQPAGGHNVDKQLLSLSACNTAISTGQMTSHVIWGSSYKHICELTGGVSATLKYKFIPKMLPAIATNATATVTMLSTCTVYTAVAVNVTCRFVWYIALWPQHKQIGNGLVWPQGRAMHYRKLSICSCWAAACMQINGEKIYSQTMKNHDLVMYFSNFAVIRPDAGS